MPTLRSGFLMSFLALGAFCTPCVSIGQENAERRYKVSFNPLFESNAKNADIRYFSITPNGGLQMARGIRILDKDTIAFDEYSKKIRIVLKILDEKKTSISAVSRVIHRMLRDIPKDRPVEFFLVVKSLQ